MTRLLLFDIDGTLVVTGGAGRRAMTDAFAELLRVRGVGGPVGEVPFAGRTDAWILASLAAHHGLADLDDPELASFRAAYLANLAREMRVDSPDQRVLPGVRPLLDTLVKRPDVCLALLTGNLKEGARIKLEHFGLWRYFAGGAFGGDLAERTSLYDHALIDVARACGANFQPEEVVVVGDTPLDVEVARAAGARSLAVATGMFGIESLREAGADVVVDNFSDLPGVLAALGLAAATPV